MAKRAKGLPVKVCACGNSFFPRWRGDEFCVGCLADIEHDCNVEMFGDDADYLEHAGLADKMGNK